MLSFSFNFAFHVVCVTLSVRAFTFNINKSSNSILQHLDQAVVGIWLITSFKIASEKKNRVRIKYKEN